MILPLQLVLSDVAVKKYSFLGGFWFKTTNEGQRNRVVIFCKERRKIECVNEPSRLEAIKTIFTRNKKIFGATTSTQTNTPGPWWWSSGQRTFFLL